jgi:hypothetical protein
MRSAVNRFGIDQGVLTTDGEWMGNGWDLRQPVLGFIQIVSVQSVVKNLLSSAAICSRNKSRIEVLRFACTPENTF